MPPFQPTKCLFALLITVMVLGGRVQAAAVPVLLGNGVRDEVVVNDGKVVMEYAPSEPGEVEVEEARRLDFSDATLRYSGYETASVFTGMAEGDHYFRMRRLGQADAAGAGAWSNIVHVRVEFMGRGALIALLATGFVVVAMTAGAIIIGHRATRPPTPVGGGAD